jgi:uroporphyrinogen-III synthase
VAEGLLEAFPDPPPTGGRVLLAQAEQARPVLADGLRARGWDVVAVVAYGTRPVVPARSLLAAAAAADAVTFTAGSGVAAYLEAAGPGALPPVVVCIGPVTAAAAARHGVTVTRVADPHDLPGLVAATVAALADVAPRGRSPRLRPPEEM